MNETKHSPSTHLCLYWTSFQHIYPLCFPSKLLWFPVQTALPWLQNSHWFYNTCTVRIVLGCAQSYWYSGENTDCFLLMSSERLVSTTSQCQLLVEEEHSTSLLSLHRKRDRNQLCCWDGTTHPGRVTCPRAWCFYCSKHTTKGFWHSTTRLALHDIALQETKTPGTHPERHLRKSKILIYLFKNAFL